MSVQLAYLGANRYSGSDVGSALCLPNMAAERLPFFPGATALVGALLVVFLEKW